MLNGLSIRMIRRTINQENNPMIWLCSMHHRSQSSQPVSHDFTIRPSRSLVPKLNRLTTMSTRSYGASKSSITAFLFDQKNLWQLRLKVVIIANCSQKVDRRKSVQLPRTGRGQPHRTTYIRRSYPSSFQLLASGYGSFIHVHNDVPLFSKPDS